MKLLAAVLFVSSSLFAQDFVGRWTGVAEGRGSRTGLEISASEEKTSE